MFLGFFCLALLNEANVVVVVVVVVDVAVAAVFPIDVNDVAAAAATALFIVVDFVVVVVYSDAVVLTLQTENSIDPVSKKNPRLFKLPTFRTFTMF